MALLTNSFLFLLAGPKPLEMIWTTMDAWTVACRGSCASCLDLVMLLSTAWPTLGTSSARQATLSCHLVRMRRLQGPPLPPCLPHRHTHHRRRSLPSLRLRRLTFPATFRSSAAQKCRTRRPEHRFALVWSRTRRSLDYRSSQWLTRQPGLRSDCRLSPAAVRPVRPSSPTHH